MFLLYEGLCTVQSALLCCNRSSNGTGLVLYFNIVLVMHILLILLVNCGSKFDILITFYRWFLWNFAVQLAFSACWPKLPVSVWGNSQSQSIQLLSLLIALPKSSNIVVDSSLVDSHVESYGLSVSCNELAGILQLCPGLEWFGRGEILSIVGLLIDSSFFIAWNIWVRNVLCLTNTLLLPCVKPVM